MLDVEARNTTLDFSKLKSIHDSVARDMRLLGTLSCDLQKE